MNPKDKNVIHVSIERWCSIKSKEGRGLIFETHIHKATLRYRAQFAWQLIMKKPIHLVMGQGSEVLRVGDRVVKEIEL